ncbi:MAG TPA: hypothetical protein VLH86_06290 [Patescibacteria group bacterium]|nr:hypothetical protein [Patescibacteria group bacterium]
MDVLVDTEPVYDLRLLEEEVRGRLEPVPQGTSEDATLVCIDARAGHPECKVLGIDHKRHVVRHAGALAGACTDLNIAYATVSPAEYAEGDAKSHEINAEIAAALAELGFVSTVHEECADMHATPETVGAMSEFDEEIFEVARDILQGDLERREYARVVAGARVVGFDRISHPEAVMQHFRSQRIPVAKLRNTDAPRRALVVNTTDKQLPPMEFNQDGVPQHTLVYDADTNLVIPKLTAVAREILTPKINRRTLDVVAATHLAVLAKKKLQLPVLVIN